ncbi:MAG: family N-acetyltransferase [Cryobacterium sp.]|jgi:ribosomal-protein-alanine N-acetyltransferase|nr:family N-acetyltransferase [Cryobacterium sp.]
MLRPWRIDDAAGLQAASTVSGDLAAQLGAIELSTIARCETFITDNLATATVSRQNFAISVDGIAVGNVGIGSMEHRHGTGWVYYWTSAEVRGQGLATLALASIADWAFTEQGLYRLELGHRTNNPGSCRVAAKAGFSAEGVERQKLKYGTERFDVETHARLRTDAPPLRAAERVLAVDGLANARDLGGIPRRSGAPTLPEACPFVRKTLTRPPPGGVSICTRRASAPSSTCASPASARATPSRDPLG